MKGDLKMTEKAIAAIEAQQKELKVNDAPYFVGEQLKEICRTTSGAAELVTQDLEVPEMSLVECEKKIKELADEKHKEAGGNFAFVSPLEADKVIREFYGIPEVSATAKTNDDFIDLDSLLGG